MPNLMEDAAFSTQDSILSTGIRSAVCAPLWSTPSTDGGQDSVIGLVYLDTADAVAPVHRGGPARRHRARQPRRGQDRERAPAGGEPREAAHGRRHARSRPRSSAACCRPRRPVVPGYGVVGSNTPFRRWAATTTTSRSRTGGCSSRSGDVSGKGTGAALLMTVLRAAVRGHWADGSVAEAVVRINSTVCQNVTAGQVHHVLRGPARLRDGRDPLRQRRPQPARAGAAPTARPRPSPAAAWCSGMFDPDSLPGGRRDASVPARRCSSSPTASPRRGARRTRSSPRTGCSRSPPPTWARTRAACTTRSCASVDAFADGRKPADDRTLIVIKRD